VKIYKHIFEKGYMKLQKPLKEYFNAIEQDVEI
jgi:hypothetical protein